MIRTRIAQKFGITDATLSRILNGHTRSIHYNTAKKMSAMLKMPADQIAGIVYDGGHSILKDKFEKLYPEKK